MQIGLWPLYSQKRDGHHVLDTCGSTKQAKFLEGKLQELGHECIVPVPRGHEKAFQYAVPIHVPISTPEQLMHWDTAVIRSVLKDADTVICWHEFLAIPIRICFPKIRIFQICAVDPRKRTGLLREAWNVADKVVVQTDTAAGFVRKETETEVAVWRMEYSIEQIKQRKEKPDIDVLFVTRCSATNYTHHEEFLDADLSGLRVVYTDVTGWLKAHRPDLKYSTPETYYETLTKAKVAVSLNDDLFGGQAIREAIASGCTPVCLDCEHYRELCGWDWPYMVRKDFRNLESVIRAAVANQRIFPATRIKSYQSAWWDIKRDLNV